MSVDFRRGASGIPRRLFLPFFVFLFALTASMRAAAGPQPFLVQFLSDADRISLQSNNAEPNLRAKFNAYKPVILAKLGGASVVRASVLYLS